MPWVFALYLEWSFNVDVGVSTAINWCVLLTTYCIGRTAWRGSLTELEHPRITPDVRVQRVVLGHPALQRNDQPVYNRTNGSRRLYLVPKHTHTATRINTL